MNYYAILGISADADDESIRRAFRALARQYHPDAGIGSSAEKFRQIFEAYETLRDPVRRVQYDASQRAIEERAWRNRMEPHRWARHIEPLRDEVRVGHSDRVFFHEVTIEELFNRIFRVFDDPVFWGPPSRR
jgi:DnaJ-class molecular chaperone